MKKWIRIITASTLLVNKVHAQKITVSGYISDTKSKERLLNADVYFPSLGIGTQTNNYGFYSITLDKPNAPLVMAVSSMGYVSASDTVVLTGNTQRNISLGQSHQLDEVVVSSSSQDRIHNRVQMSQINLPMELVKKLPSLMGEVDLMKSLQLLPGVQAGNEGQNGLYVRGGAPDENLILLDGVPVYNANHLFGFLSVFNSDAISQVDIYKGGFPARFGGRLSSVLDIKMKEGSKDGVHGSFGISPLAGRLMLEGPFSKSKKGSWLISGRRTFVDAFMTPISKSRSNGANSTGYYFWDLNAKANYTLGERDRIYISAYAGNDKFFSKGFENKKEVFNAKINWGNVTSMLRWNHQFGQKVFGNLTGSYSRYQFNVNNKIKVDNDEFASLYQSKIVDFALKYDIDYALNPNHFIKLGVNATYHTFVPGAVNVKGATANLHVDTNFKTSKAPELDVYVEDNIQITDKLKANIGLHLSGFKTENNFYTSLQPRVSARYLLSDDLSLKASYATMAQYIHLLSNSTVGLPTDLWLPVTDKIKPMTSNQYAIGLAKSFKKNYDVSIEAFYKKMDNVIEYKEGSNYLNSNESWENKVEMGKGWSYGAEFFVQKNIGRLTGLMGYTLSWSKRQFPNINAGEVFPYKFDRRNDFKIAGVYKWKKNIELSGNWVYGTGNAITMPIYSYSGGGAYDLVNNDGNGYGGIYQYGSRNNYRMKPYHRLDVGISFNKITKRKNLRTWNVSVYNVYNRANPYYIYPDVSSGGNTNFKQMSLFPVLPSISYSLKF